MQNSQRVLLAKPRTAPMARRREPGGPAAKHRALPQRGTGGARRNGRDATGARAVRAQPDHGGEKRMNRFFCRSEKTDGRQNDRVV